MRPTRKSRSVNNWHDYFSDIYSEKDVDNYKRENHQKRKLSETSQWSKEELSRFYAAYREYGKDWKKVAAIVRNRSAEMVESIYTMNMAYLSLPEGTASVVGFIAMMLEHYSNLSRSDSEQERNGGATASQKTKKRAWGKAEPGNSEASSGKCNVHSLTAESGYGCMPLMKRKHTGGSRPHAAGKRTPRFPVSYSCENIEGDKFLPLSRQNWKKKADANASAAAREIGLSLTEASAKGGSPQVSQTPNRITTSVMSSSVQNSIRKFAGLEMANAVENDRNDEHLEGSMKADTSELSRHRTYLKRSGQVATLVQKGRNIDVKKLDAYDGRDNCLDDQTDVGQRSRALHEKLNRDARIANSSLQGSRKKSKKVCFSRDEVSAIEALQTLADLSLKMPSGGNEDESRVQIKEEKDDHFHEFGSLKATAGKSQRAKHRSSGVRVKGDRSISRSEAASSRIPKSGKGSSIDDNAVPEKGEEANQCKAVRKKRNMLTSKARDVEKVNKSKKSAKNASSKLMKDAEQSSRTHPRREGSDPAQSTPQVCQVNKISLPTRVRSRCKMHLKGPQKQKDLKIPEQPKALTALVHDTAFALKDKLINCLSSHRLRRWCTYEWFYSAIDYPWFAKREFVEYLSHVGLGHIPKLTRAEWGVLRSSLGKPRRFSQQFLKEEKKELNQYRDSVREHYTDLRKGTLEGLLQDLARPLSVGQHVIAIHPKAREIHDGNVLTVDDSRCRVQFDQPELGIEFVMDIDCMPLNHLESISTPLVGHMTCNKLFKNNEHQMNEQPKEYIKAFSGDEIRNINCLPHLSPSTFPLNKLLNLTKVKTSEDANLRTRIVPTETSAHQEMVYSQPCTLAQIQAKETDVQALAQLACAHDKKVLLARKKMSTSHPPGKPISEEAVVFALKHVNNELVDNCPLKELERFKNLLVQLQEENEQVSSPLSHLRQRNALQKTILLSWPGSVANFGDHGGPLNYLDHSACQPYLSGSHINEIIESSRVKARTMVHVAMQTMSSLQRRVNTLEKIEEAIDIVNEQLPLDDSFIPLPTDPMTIASDKNDAQIPSELITQCVATLLMIQKCTERQFPPADIAQILQSAVASLKPRCSQNLPAYAEIQRCMGRIRNEILSLLPT